MRIGFRSGQEMEVILKWFNGNHPHPNPPPSEGEGIFAYPYQSIKGFSEVGIEGKPCLRLRFHPHPGLPPSNGKGCCLPPP